MNPSPLRHGPPGSAFAAVPADAGTASARVRATSVVPPAPAPATAAATPAAKIPQAVQLEGRRHAVLLFHGLSSTPLELLYLARGLNQAGFTVRLPVIGGYSHGLKGSADHREWTTAALAEFDSMRTKYDSVAVGGLCIGALLALRVAAERPNLVSAVMGLSTTLYYDGWANTWSRFLLPLVPFVPFSGNIAIVEREPFGVKDERLRAWISAQMRESGGSDAGAAKLRVRDLYEAQRLGGMVRRSLPAIVAPTLVIHALEDDAASPRSAREVAERVSSQHVKRLLLKESYHMISIDQEKHVVLAEMKEFMLAPSRNTSVDPEAVVRKNPLSDVLRSARHVHA